MIKNYLKIAFRTIQRQKFYAGINVLGLTVGIASSLVILLFIIDALSYDTFHNEYKLINRMNLKGRLNGQDFDGFSSCLPLAEAMRNEIPEIKDAVRFRISNNVVIRSGDKSFTEKDVLIADSNFFQFFTFPILEGDPKTVLMQPNNVVLTERMAKKYFGYTIGGKEPSPVGKEILLGTTKRVCKVTGIARNVPSNSHFDFDLVVSFNTYDYSFMDQWTSNGTFTFVKRKEGTVPAAVNKKVAALVRKYVGPELEDFLNMPYEEFEKQGGHYGYYMQPIGSIHLNADLGRLKPGPTKIQLILFTLIAVFIILIACINFMNLSTARSAMRSKEVGIRKTLGALRGSLIRQFLSESMAYSLISMVLALGLCYLVLPLFNGVAGKTLSMTMFYDTGIVLSLLLFVVVIGLFSGSYPAFYLTAFNPAEVLKGSFKTKAGGGRIRSLLVVFQFIISITLMVSTLFIYKQLVFMRKANLGFDKSRLVVLDNARGLGENKEVFKNNLLAMPAVASVSYSNMVPPDINNNSVFRAVGSSEDVLMFAYYADQDHLQTMGYELLEGRYFSEKYKSDTAAIVMNRAAKDFLGWDSIEDKQLLNFYQSEEGEIMNVIGVVKDFNFQSLHNEIQPLVILLDRNSRNMAAIKLEKGDVMATVQGVKEQWVDLSDGAPFDYSFMDDAFNKLFGIEKRLGDLFLIFTALSIFIGSLGLLGLATFTAEQKTKEIGIRKVMGASVLSIIVLFTRDFTRLLLISFVLSCIAAYFIVNYWLKNFAFRVDIDILTFIMGGAVAYIITWITVAYQIYKASIKNPVLALKSE